MESMEATREWRIGRSLVLVMSVASTAREGVSGMRIMEASAVTGDCAVGPVTHNEWRRCVREAMIVERDG